MGNLDTVSHIILTRWRKYFSQLLNVHGVNDVKQTKKHEAEELVPEASAFEVKIYQRVETTHITTYLADPYRIEERIVLINSASDL